MVESSILAHKPDQYKILWPALPTEKIANLKKKVISLVKLVKLVEYYKI